MARKRPALVALEPGEARVFWFLFVEYFFLGVTSVFTQASSFALFLTEFGSQGLPASYVATAVGASLAAFLYLKISDRFSLATTLIINLSSLAVLSLLLRAGLAQADARWVVFALPVWFQIVANLTNLALWTLAGRLLNVRQGKRLFGLIGTGNWIAIAAGGFVVSPIVAALGTPNLLLLAGVSLLVALGFQLVLLRENRARLVTTAPLHTPADTARESSRHLWQSRYILLILAVVVISWIGFFFIDNTFYAAASSQISDLDQLAGFIGSLIAATGIIGLLTTTFLTGPVITRFGVGISLLVLPVILTAATGLLVLGGTLLGVGVVVFALASFNKVMDVALGFTLDLSARTILYQPLPPRERVRIHTIADGIVSPISIGVAGLLLLVFNTLLGFHAVELSYLFLAIGIGWILIGLSLRREYPRALAQAIAKRRFGEHTTLPTDRASLALLKGMLHDARPQAALYAANTLHQLEPSVLADALPELLAHPSPEVRRDALERLGVFDQTSACALMRERLAVEALPELRAGLFRALANLGGTKEREQIMTALDDSSPEVRLSAIAGLIYAGEPSVRRAAEEKLLHMISSENAEERSLVAQVIGELARDRPDLVQKLLTDAEVKVQRAALRSLAGSHDPAMYSLAVERLSSPSLRRTAIATLAAGGEAVLPLVKHKFQESGATPQVLGALAQVCAQIGDASAIEILRPHIAQPDSDLRLEVLAALSQLGYQAGAQDTMPVRQSMRTELNYASGLLAADSDIGIDRAVEPLHSALALEIEQCRSRLFYLLSFLYDGHAILDARTNLFSPFPEKRAYALEVLDIGCPAELKPYVFPLFERLAAAECLARLAPLFPQQGLAREARLTALIDAPDSTPWIKRCAQYAAFCLGLKASSPAPDGGVSVVSTIEKLVALKGVDLFAGTPDPILADVAAAMDQIEVDAGARVFEKGDPGDSLYVILAGQVRVHDGAEILNVLGEGDVFGEMALLDPEPRLASVTASQDTQLLRLDQQSFQELLEERSEIARNVIRVLTRRLRARVQDLTTARSTQQDSAPSRS